MFRVLNLYIIGVFFFNTLGPSLGLADTIVLPAPGAMVRLSPTYNLPILKGIKVNPDNPFKFEFIMSVGDGSYVSKKGESTSPIQEESKKLIKYFLAALTIPEKDLWVNLSPYEKDRIIPDSFGQTEMGRDLLAQDYLLKQITASLIYPEDEIGMKFWKRVYQEVHKRGLSSASQGNYPLKISTFNKVWIVPEKAVVYENLPDRQAGAKAGVAYVVESRLKVLTEADYLANTKNNLKDDNQNQIIKDIVIPALTKEVNEGQNFAQLRQVYNSFILAAWYKKKISAIGGKENALYRGYIDKNKISGININDPQAKTKIYNRYLEAFRKGAYNYIKEEPDSISGQMIPRKYFSGGMRLNDEAMIIKDGLNSGVLLPEDDSNQLVKVELSAHHNAAMLSNIDRAESKGARDRQEDRDINDLIVDEEGKVIGRLIAVMDGHHRGKETGDIISEFVKRQVLQIFRKYLLVRQKIFITARDSGKASPEFLEKNNPVSKALEETFKELNKLTKNYVQGTTLSMVYVPVEKDRVYYAVLGDSPVIFVKKDGSHTAIMQAMEDYVATIHDRINRENMEKSANVDNVAISLNTKTSEGRMETLYSRVPAGLGSQAFEGILIRGPLIGFVPYGDIRIVITGSDGVLVEGNPSASIQKIVELVKSRVNAHDIINDPKNTNPDNKTLVIWRPDPSADSALMVLPLKFVVGNMISRILGRKHETERQIQDYLDSFYGEYIEPYDKDDNTAQAGPFRLDALPAGQHTATFAQIYQMARFEHDRLVDTFGYPMSARGFYYLFIKTSRHLPGMRIDIKRANYVQEINDFKKNFMGIKETNAIFDSRTVMALLGYQSNEFLRFFSELSQRNLKSLSLRDVNRVEEDVLKQLAVKELMEYIQFIKMAIMRDPSNKIRILRQVLMIPIESVRIINGYNEYFDRFYDALNLVMKGNFINKIPDYDIDFFENYLEQILLRLERLVSSLGAPRKPSTYTLRRTGRDVLEDTAIFMQGSIDDLNRDVFKYGNNYFFLYLLNSLWITEAQLRQEPEPTQEQLLTPNSSPKEFRTVLRNIVRTYHPDGKGLSGMALSKATARVQILNNLWFLSREDDPLRKIYLQTGQLPVDEAMSTIQARPTGGIDLGANKDALQVKNSPGGEIKFNASAVGGSAFDGDPAMLKELEISQGLEIKVLEIKPLDDLRRFLAVAPVPAVLPSQKP